MSLFDLKFIEDNVLGNSELEEVLAEIEKVCNVEVLLTDKAPPECNFIKKKMDLTEKIDRLIQKYIFDEDPSADAIVSALKVMKAKVEEITGEKNTFSGKDSEIYNEEVMRFNELVEKKILELKKL